MTNMATTPFRASAAEGAFTSGGAAAASAKADGPAERHLGDRRLPAPPVAGAHGTCARGGRGKVAPPHPAHGRQQIARCYRPPFPGRPIATGLGHRSIRRLFFARAGAWCLRPANRSAAGRPSRYDHWTRAGNRSRPAPQPQTP
jgi:hypothetical protein